jgi:beta-phosphoglucomutase-like phosphatase (HAD superfamily)
LKLHKVGLLEAFAPHIYSAQIVPRGKPAPDIYLHAAHAIDVAPAHCIAVEDSVNGTVSARAAGMTVIGFTGGGHCPPSQAARLREAGAAHVATTMDELRPLLVS